MLGRSLEPLAVRVSRVWRDLLKRRKEDAADQALLPPVQKLVTRIIATVSIVLPLSLALAVWRGISNKLFNGDLLYGVFLAPLVFSVLSFALGIAWSSRRLLLLGCLTTYAYLSVFVVILLDDKLGLSGSTEDKVIAVALGTTWLFISIVTRSLGFQKRTWHRIETEQLRTVRGLVVAGALTHVLVPVVAQMFLKQ